MATKAPLKHFDCIATYHCRYFVLMTACFLDQIVKSVCVFYWYIDAFFVVFWLRISMEHDLSMNLVRISWF